VLARNRFDSQHKLVRTVHSMTHCGIAFLSVADSLLAKARSLNTTPLTLLSAASVGLDTLAKTRPYWIFCGNPNTIGVRGVSLCREPLFEARCSLPLGLSRLGRTVTTRPQISLLQRRDKLVGFLGFYLGRAGTLRFITLTVRQHRFFARQFKQLVRD
jgi:hypothetical protein